MTNFYDSLDTFIFHICVFKPQDLTVVKMLNIFPDVVEKRIAFYTDEFQTIPSST